ncbi:ribokinase, partial [Mycobacterium avium subsp. hominissuis]|nr:ribokinase [Mycobacterium avium subsp. hominissuis]
MTVCRDADPRQKARAPGLVWPPGRRLTSAPMTDVCVVGSVNLDLSLAVDALPRPGET